MKSNKSPVIEIHGTGVHNRGAELMAIAISEKIWSVYPNAKIAVPSTFGLQNDIKRYGFTTTLALEIKRKRPLYSLLIGVLTGNIIHPREVDIVLDASGFAFSDQWGVEHAKRLGDKLNNGYRKKQALILLPQALGPFNNSAVKKYSKLVFDRASLVFARDTQSHMHVSKVISDLSNLQQSPDFTVNIKPMEKKSIELPEKFVAIVPNARMLDKMDNAEDYLAFLRHAVDIIKAQNITPVFVVHDGYQDREVVSQLGEKYQNVPIIQDQDPRVLKWILGKSEFVIGSRFHALVSALSQGVLCIGVGWSHKYPELFNDFSNSEGLIANMKDIAALENLVSKYSDQDYKKIKSQEVVSAANKIKNQVDDMWDIVINQINMKIGN